MWVYFHWVLHQNHSVPLQPLYLSQHGFWTSGVINCYLIHVTLILYQSRRSSILFILPLFLWWLNHLSNWDRIKYSRGVSGACYTTPLASCGALSTCSGGGEEFRHNWPFAHKYHFVVVINIPSKGQVVEGVIFYNTVLACQKSQDCVVSGGWLSLCMGE